MLCQMPVSLSTLPSPFLSQHRCVHSATLPTPLRDTLLDTEPSMVVPQPGNVSYTNSQAAAGRC